MPSFATFLDVADAVIASIQPGDLSADCLHQLSIVFPESLLLAALDLVDRSSVIECITPGYRSCHRVLGSTATYTVFPYLTLSSAKRSMYCTCPAFVYAVLMTNSHLMCKHLLATRLAERLGKCVQKQISVDELVAISALAFKKL